MTPEDFDYELPEDQIAQYPLKERDKSRLMLLNKEDGRVVHSKFRQLKKLLKPGDVLVLNDTKVISARLTGRRKSGGKVELFLVKRLDDNDAGDTSELWRALVKNAKGLKVGAQLSFAGDLTATLKESHGDGEWTALLECSSTEYKITDLIEKIGTMPLPPYIKRGAKALDRRRYQTIIADKPGAIAAPTAGLHFTEKVLDDLVRNDITVCRLTLHTGLATFLPIRTKLVEDHRMHTEQYSIDPTTFAEIKTAKDEGRRIVAVGSTSVRALESAVAEGFDSPKLSGETDIYIYPGYEFKAVDAMLTNFHLPRSTLLLMVSAFAGKENVLCAYEEAVEEGYRFFSYGDCMLIE
ncbi:MAG: tRNA preQ1(34) S-adenosylmethionine ribosyltransferase-isomerase QueA [Thermodesulfobacteriota bacterium]